MAIDFTLTPEQKRLQSQARELAEEVLAPIVPQADAEPDPVKAFQLTKAAYLEAHGAGLAFGFIPKEYGGQGLSLLDVVIASEEICAVDPGFGCTLLCNALGYMPVLWFGSEEQKDRFLRAATSDESGEYIAGYMASEPPGTPGGPANFDCPLPRPAGLGVTAVRDGDHVVLNGRKRWPGNVTGWDMKGAHGSVAVVRTDPGKGGTEGLSAIVIERGTPGITYEILDKLGHRLHGNTEITFDNARVPAANLLEGAKGNGDLVINRAWSWTGPVSAIAAITVARAAYEAALKWTKTYTAGGPRPMIGYQNAGYLLGDVAARIEMCRAFCWKAAQAWNEMASRAAADERTGSSATVSTAAIDAGVAAISSDDPSRLLDRSVDRCQRALPLQGAAHDRSPLEHWSSKAQADQWQLRGISSSGFCAFVALVCTSGGCIRSFESEVTYPIPREP